MFQNKKFKLKHASEKPLVELIVENNAQWNWNEKREKKTDFDKRYGTKSGKRYSRNFRNSLLPKEEPERPKTEPITNCKYWRQWKQGRRQSQG